MATDNWDNKDKLSIRTKIALRILTQLEIINASRYVEVPASFCDLEVM